jgi:hypothetical protein
VVGSSAWAARSKKFDPVTWSASRQAKSIGTVPRQPSRDDPRRHSGATRAARPSIGWKRSATNNIEPNSARKEGPECWSTRRQRMPYSNTPSLH